MAHNHPSGNLQPSTPDKFMTEKVEKTLSIMDMKFLDHLIVTSGGYFSFVDEVGDVEIHYSLVLILFFIYCSVNGSS